MTGLTPDLPYRVKVRNPDWASAQEWCNQYVGEFDKDWYKMGVDIAEFVNGEQNIFTVWFFRLEKDAILFALRWS